MILLKINTCQLPSDIHALWIPRVDRCIRLASQLGRLPEPRSTQQLRSPVCYVCACSLRLDLVSLQLEMQLDGLSKFLRSGVRKAGTPHGMKES